MVIFQIQIFWVMMLLSMCEWFPVLWNARSHSCNETVSWTQQCYCQNHTSGKDFLHLGSDNVVTVVLSIQHRIVRQLVNN